ncbi:hypothetical protein D910_12047 [Dendroctonus ponderosae]|uniref:Ig-like domain-containing protein n=1 Tax=Dendroctonus ponderosae TaxID=77166 RepID=U4UQG8_DENPD|nr:hypothetical protein D910_12047 [Dendroctonus ponderosae]
MEGETNNANEDEKCDVNIKEENLNYFANKQVIQIPPNIDDSLSSSDVIVREGSNETLFCKATGFPEPSLKWKRDDGAKFSINKTHKVYECEGEKLELYKISRLDMGAYLCIATNGIPPSVSKRIKLSLTFVLQMEKPNSDPKFSPC